VGRWIASILDDYDHESFDCGTDGLLGIARAEIATPYGE